MTSQDNVQDLLARMARRQDDLERQQRDITRNFEDFRRDVDRLRRDTDSRLKTEERNIKTVEHTAGIFQGLTWFLLGAVSLIGGATLVLLVKHAA